MQYRFQIILTTLLALAVSACSTSSQQPSGNASAQPNSNTSVGNSQVAIVAAAKAKTEARYAIKQDLGPKQHLDMSKAPDAIPKVEPHSRGGNKSQYQVWGKSYSVMASSVGYQERGLASWYGQKFHGHLTSNGETYDMYAMSAAHKSLPLPTFFVFISKRSRSLSSIHLMSFLLPTDTKSSPCTIVLIPRSGW